jgi:glycerophosphoryl diester phosphodiesterase
MDLGGGARIPTLVGALEWAALRGISLNIEMKHDVPHRWELARATLRAVRASASDVLLSSFDPILLAMALALAPEVPRALLTHARQGWWSDALRRVVGPPFVSALHVEAIQASATAIAASKARHVRVGVWTVNDPGEAVTLVRRGVSTLITDQPGAIAQATRR